jgi:hypothetical protein
MHAGGDEIVVTGETPERAKREAYTFVRELGVQVGTRQAARWSSPVCPRALGVSDTYAAMVERRIRSVANAAGAPVAPEGCEGNFAILFTTEGAAFVRKMDDRDSSRLRKLRANAQRQLKQAPLPVRWWYNTRVIGRDGRPLVSFPPAGVPAMGDEETKYLSLYEPGRISTPTTRGITDVSIVIDVNLAEGKFLGSLIDYAALVGLAEIRLGAAPRNSILSLFAPSPPTQLTSNDSAFLKALYAMPLDRVGRQQRQTIVNSLVRANQAAKRE